MTQKRFIFIFLLMIWNSSTSSGNTTKHLHFWLGCRAVIPCQHYSSESFRWYYMKDEHSITQQIFLQDKNGVQHHNAFQRRGSVMHDRSLVISPFTEDDQGTYWCENCSQNNCWKNPSTVIRVKKENLNEIHKTFYITAGSSFSHACPGEFTDLKWTFEASSTTALRKSVLRPDADIVTSNKLIHIVNVTVSDAGKYTCWMSNCDKHSKKLLIINVCVITVHRRKASSLSCAVVCDVEFNNPNITSNVKTGTTTISVHVDSYGSSTCSAEQIFDGYTTVSNNNVPSDAFHKTKEAEYPAPVIYGLAAVFACLILTAILIFYFRSRLKAALPVHISCCGFNDRVEEETSVVYSSVVIRTPAKTTNHHVTYSDCIYSQIQV